MPEQPQTIENLMKVTLTIQTADPSVADDSSKPFVFIYGVGPSGITPFEKALHGKGVGDRIRLDMTPSTLCETVGHLELPLGTTIRHHGPCFAPGHRGRCGKGTGPGSGEGHGSRWQLQRLRLRLRRPLTRTVTPTGGQPAGIVK